MGVREGGSTPPLGGVGRLDFRYTVLIVLRLGGSLALGLGHLRVPVLIFATQGANVLDHPLLLECGLKYLCEHGQALEDRQAGNEADGDPHFDRKARPEHAGNIGRPGPELDPPVRAHPAGRSGATVVHDGSATGPRDDRDPDRCGLLRYGPGWRC